MQRSRILCFIEDDEGVVQGTAAHISQGSNFNDPGIHEMFQPAGTNANFTQVLAGDTLMVRTYERGVEGETMACGTGAVASALIAVLLEQANPPVTVITSGGEKLTIHFSIRLEGSERRLDLAAGIFLEGPAHETYEGEMGPEALQE